MKLIWIWTTVLGTILATIVGCGNTEDSIREVPKPAVPSDVPILGEWQLQKVVWFKNGVETQRIDYSSIPYSLTFAPDGIFDVIYRVPIDGVADAIWLESLELEHLQDQDIIVTFRGKFQISDNQLWLELTSASAKPKEAGKIDSDYEDPVFIYHLGDPGPLGYTFGDDRNRLELIRQKDISQDIYMVKFSHRQK